jgi:hypothetical protein
MYARTNRRYNERVSRTNYVRSSITHCALLVTILDKIGLHDGTFITRNKVNNVRIPQHDGDVRVTIVAVAKQ